MDNLNKTIAMLHDDLVNNRVTSYELVEESCKKVTDDTCNMYEKKIVKDALKRAKKKTSIDKNKLLEGIPFVMKDNFSTKGIESTASSNSLNGYIPLYDATVYKKLKKAGAILIAKTSMDELAMGGTGTTSHIGPTLNPLDKTRIIGGSSAGSCAAVVASHCPFSIGSDTGDSVRKPASYGGIVGFKPTYGLVSRYGLFAFAQSLDTVAYFSKDVLDSAILTEVLAGYDKNDSTSYKGKYDKTFIKHVTDGVKSAKLCYFPQLVDNIKDKNIVDEYYKLIEKLKKHNITVEKCEIDEKLLNAIYPAYMIISSAEASSNNACLDGLRYGISGDINADNYREYIKQARSKGFSDMIKRRFVIGSFSLLSDNKQEIFLRAQKARTRIVKYMKEVFSKYDGLLVPASQNVAPLLSDIVYSWTKEPNYIDNHMAIGNFGGFPSITLPWIEKDNLPIGINLTSDNFKDANLLGIAKVIEDTVKEEN